MTFTQRGIDPDKTRPFWNDMLDALVQLLASTPREQRRR